LDERTGIVANVGNMARKGVRSWYLSAHTKLVAGDELPQLMNPFLAISHVTHRINYADA